jgi:hypothetical protein
VVEEVEKAEKAKVENLTKEAAGLFRQSHHQYHELQTNNISYYMQHCL